MCAFFYFIFRSSLCNYLQSKNHAGEIHFVRIVLNCPVLVDRPTPPADGHWGETDIALIAGVDVIIQEKKKEKKKSPGTPEASRLLEDSDS